MHLGHILRLLATHHIIRECEPDIFALNRVSALLDSGRSFTECRSACVVPLSSRTLLETNAVIVALLENMMANMEALQPSQPSSALLLNYCTFAHELVRLQYR
jgi:hypothetical protein